MTKTDFKHIRFLGAEGIGMSALIRILEEQVRAGIKDPKLKISKSDLSYSANDPLDADIDLVVRSTAIASTDPDYVELQSRGLEIWHRSDMLNFLTQGYKQVVVSGTHGKTSCSAILSHILVSAGLDPCFAVGGILKNYSSNGRFGRGQYFVLEGDESDKSFTKTSPYMALVTNIEPDHLENYPGGIAEIKKCFFDFLDRAQIKIICIDNPLLKEYYDCHFDPQRSEGEKSNAQVITYSAKELKDYDLDFLLKGEYNKLNALGCLKAAQALGVSKEAALVAIKTFSGIKRRFELVNESYTPPSLQGAADGHSHCAVYDDYAHHPTEVRAILEAALSLKPKKLLFVYQPHHPERTQQFWEEFVDVFKNFPQEHKCLLVDIYVARSKHIEGINSERMVKQINNPAVKYLAPLAHSKTVQGNIKDMTAALKPSIDAELAGCDYLFIVGAGDIAKIVPAFIN